VRGHGWDRTEAGFIAAELALGVAVLLLPVAAVVLTIPTWSQRQTTGRAIVREVARIVARDGTCDADAGVRLAETMAVNLGLARDDLTVDLGCVARSPLEPGTSLQASVTIRMPAVHLPGLGSVGEWTWTARHRHPVDAYLSAP
jgi:hypothetical protein